MSTMVSSLELIRRVPLFSMLTTGQAESVAQAVIKRRYKRGEAIVEQGQKSNALAIILTGRARVVTTDARGREVSEMVSRVMKDLEACGFIETRTDGSMWVKDRLNTLG